jgi:hypothetical protein
MEAAQAAEPQADNIWDRLRQSGLDIGNLALADFVDFDAEVATTAELKECNIIAEIVRNNEDVDIDDEEQQSETDETPAVRGKYSDFNGLI